MPTTRPWYMAHAFYDPDTDSTTEGDIRTLTRDQLEQLAAEAGGAGDQEMVTACHRAIVERDMAGINYRAGE